MFSTFKYDPDTRQVQEIRSTFDPVTARSSQHQACNNCHTKKLKCSGEKSGCERCAVSQLPCEYTRSSSRASRRGKKPAGSGRSSPGSNSSSSSSSRSSRQQPPHRSRHSAKRAGKSSPSSRSSRGDDDDDDDDNDGSSINALEQLDASMLGPEDGFDLRSLSIASGMSAATGYASSSSSSTVDAFAGASGYYGQHQHAASGTWPATSQAAAGAAYDGSSVSYMGGGGGATAGFTAQEYYANFQDYSQFQNPPDPRYWSEGQ